MGGTVKKIISRRIIQLPRNTTMDRFAGYLIMTRRHLHKKAGYIDADFLHPPTFPLQSDGGPYILGNYLPSNSNLPKADFAGITGLFPDCPSSGNDPKTNLRMPAPPLYPDEV